MPIVIDVNANASSGRWITRINAQSRANGMTYSRLINGLKRAEIGLDRRVLADLAVHDKEAFAAVVERARTALAA